MADPTYGPKVYKKAGGDELVVASGGKVTVESGGQILVGATDVAALLTAIPTSDPGDGVTLWNDAGVLKVASGP